LLCRQRALHSYRGRDRVTGPHERHEERVPLRVDLATAVTGTRGPDHAIVTAHNLHVALAELAKQTGGTLDIGKQERDGSAWQTRHGPWLRPSTPHVKATNRR
jgi:hypothetical protein